MTYNRGKKSVALDFAKPEGQDVVHRLLASADVMVENFRPGVLKKYGLDYPSLHAKYPKLIYLSISAYGQTKLLGEQYVERFCRRHFIVRTAWLYSSYGKNFVKTMIRLGRTHDKITVVNDQLGNPTNAVDLAYHILKLAVSHDYGIYHCTGNGICSWYDFACAIMQGAGLSCKVEPVTSAEYAAANPASANRPAWSALENRMLRCTVGDEMRDWQDALKDFFANWNGEL